MKKLLLPLIAIVALAGCATRPSTHINIDTSLEARVEQPVIANFTGEETDAINKALEIISERYELPPLLFYKSDEIDFAGRSPGLVGENSEWFPSWAPLEGHEFRYLILLKDMEFYREAFENEDKYPDGTKRPLNEYWAVPSERPMVDAVAHEIGHVYFEKATILDQFRELDRITDENTGEKLIGHPSYYSYFNWIGPDVCDEIAIDMANEQFAECFNYLIFSHNYMGNDLLTQIKLYHTEQAMEQFRSSE